jgi:hypothetical protein
MKEKAPEPNMYIRETISMEEINPLEEDNLFPSTIIMICYSVNQNVTTAIIMDIKL